MNRTEKKIHELIDGQRQHVLIQGDCLHELRHLPDGCVDALVTDPPYGVAWQGKSNKQRGLMNDDRPFFWWLFQAERVMARQSALMCFCPWRLQESFRVAIDAAGLKIRSQGIWDRVWRSGMGDCKAQLAPCHGVIWLATKGRFNWPGKRPPSVFAARNVASAKRHHLTEKPLDLMRDLIEATTPEGGIVLDPCMGSGSTAVAAIQTGRRVIGIELDPIHYATAQKRVREAIKNRNIKPSRAHGTTACFIDRRVA